MEALKITAVCNFDVGTKLWLVLYSEDLSQYHSRSFGETNRIILYACSVAILNIPDLLIRLWQQLMTLFSVWDGVGVIQCKYFDCDPT